VPLYVPFAIVIVLIVPCISVCLASNACSPLLWQFAHSSPCSSNFKQIPALSDKPRWHLRKCRCFEVFSCLFSSHDLPQCHRISYRVNLVGSTGGYRWSWLVVPLWYSHAQQISVPFVAFGRKRDAKPEQEHQLPCGRTKSVPI